MAIIMSKNLFLQENEFSEEVIKIYEKNPKFVQKTAIGTHHVHLNNPEEVFSKIESFMGWK